MFYAGFQFNMMNTIIQTILQISEKMPQVSKNQLTLFGVTSGITLCSEGGQFDHSIFEVE